MTIYPRRLAQPPTNLLIFFESIQVNFAQLRENDLWKLRNIKSEINILINKILCYNISQVIVILDPTRVATRKTEKRRTTCASTNINKTVTLTTSTHAREYRNRINLSTLK